MLSRSINDTSRVIRLMIVGEPTIFIAYNNHSGNSSCVIYNCNIFITQATGTLLALTSTATLATLYLCFQNSTTKRKKKSYVGDTWTLAKKMKIPLDSFSTTLKSTLEQQSNSKLTCFWLIKNVRWAEEGGILSLIDRKWSHFKHFPQLQIFDEENINVVCTFFWRHDLQHNDWIATLGITLMIWRVRSRVSFCVFMQNYVFWRVGIPQITLTIFVLFALGVFYVTFTEYPFYLLQIPFSTKPRFNGSLTWCRR